jgi:3-isopropylmalate/(R)-2-methylmalate dehydratase small subunit
MGLGVTVMTILTPVTNAAHTFSVLTSTCVPLNRNNVDTDQIIPARFLKGTAKTGLGQVLFYDLRYHEDGSPITSFALNDVRFAGGKILVAAHNFGCGSSREHAPWSLKDYGFQAVIAVSFADIFRNNATKNGLLPVILPEAIVMSLFAAIESTPSVAITIDLPQQVVMIPGQAPVAFEIDPFRKTCLLEGLDDIGYTFKHQAAIAAYEAKVD